MRYLHLARMLLASSATLVSCSLPLAAQDKNKAATQSKPATPAQAAAELKLDELPVLEGASEPSVRLVTSLAYQVKQPVKKSYTNIQKQLVERGWKELPDASVTDDYASGTFAKKGYHVSLSVMPSNPSEPKGESSVRLQHHGNVDLAKLPTGRGAKSIYVGPLSAIFSSDEPADKLNVAIREQLLKSGWEPYGGSPGISEYRQQGVVLTSMIMDAVPPMQGTNIQYSARMIAVEIPAPAESEEVQFADDILQLNFDSALDAPALAGFYRERLGGLGWKPTTDHWVDDSGVKSLIFRNEAGDLLLMEQRSIDGKSRVSVRHQSAAQVAAETKRFQAAAEKAKMKKDSGAEKTKVKLAAPQGAKQLSRSPNAVQWQVESGTAMKHVRGMRTALIDAGWKETSSTLDALAGVVLLERKEMTLTIDYNDTGVLPAEISVRASQCELE